MVSTYLPSFIDILLVLVNFILEVIVLVYRRFTDTSLRSRTNIINPLPPLLSITVPACAYLASLLATRFDLNPTFFLRCQRITEIVALFYFLLTGFIKLPQNPLSYYLQNSYGEVLILSQLSAIVLSVLFVKQKTVTPFFLFATTVLAQVVVGAFLFMVPFTQKAFRSMSACILPDYYARRGYISLRSVIFHLLVIILYTLASIGTWIVMTKLLLPTFNITTTRKWIFSELNSCMRILGVWLASVDLLAVILFHTAASASAPNDHHRISHHTKRKIYHLLVFVCCYYPAGQLNAQCSFLTCGALGVVLGLFIGVNFFIYGSTEMYKSKPHSEELQTPDLVTNDILGTDTHSDTSEDSEQSESPQPSPYPSTVSNASWDDKSLTPFQEVAHKVRYILSSLLDSRDTASFPTSHITLLVAAATPFILGTQLSISFPGEEIDLIKLNLPPSLVNSLTSNLFVFYPLTISGVIIIGLGDSVAAIIGESLKKLSSSRHARHNWPFSKKSVEGSIMATMLSLLVLDQSHQRAQNFCVRKLIDIPAENSEAFCPHHLPNQKIWLFASFVVIFLYEVYGAINDNVYLPLLGIIFISLVLMIGNAPMKLQP